jgi:hypothetical protein
MKTYAITLSLCLLAACSTTTPDYDSKFGDAVSEARLKMTISPDAGKSADSATGVDGKAANDAMTSYHNTFKAPPPAASVTNIGGSLSSGGGGSGM